MEWYSDDLGWAIFKSTFGTPWIYINKTWHDNILFTLPLLGEDKVNVENKQYGKYNTDSLFSYKFV